MQQPPLIEYNLRNRGREFTGVERNLNIKTVVDYINGPVMQEKIKNRAVTGYYGHGVRKIAGLEPVENVVVNGKINDIEPAIITTFLEADQDGTVRHKTEFLDTIPGRKAARAYSNRVGGFSSAIDGKTFRFFGFDYVLDPNYTTNRGYILDSAVDVSNPETVEQILDSVREEEDAIIQRIIDAKDAQIMQLTMALDSASAEIEDYLGMLAARDMTPSHGAGILPVSIHLDSARKIENDIAFFRSAKLPVMDVPDKKDDAYSATRNLFLG